MTVSISGTNGVTFPDSSLQAAAASPYVLKNRIINGDMRIDQRNAGASVTASVTNTSTYTVDRWSYYATQASKFTVQQNAGSVTPPVGFNNYLGVTITSAVTSPASGDVWCIQQVIEGYNTADLGWGSANVSTVTLSFWARSSLTGTFTGAIQNGNGGLTYPFTYSISSANTWTQISVTIPGATSGTWLKTNGGGPVIIFNLGGGSSQYGTVNTWQGGYLNGATGATQIIATNGATWYVTGVQLEVGTSATPFERRLYGQELILCERYYEKSYDYATVPGTASVAYGMQYQYVARSTPHGYAYYITRYKTMKRIPVPTITIYSYAGTAGQISNADSGADLGAVSILYPSQNSFLTQNNSGVTVAANAIGWSYTSSAEL